MKLVLQIALWGVSIFFGYMIYKSVQGPIEFKKVKEKRYSEVISKLKDIRDSQEAYRTVNGKYANDFPTLVSFIESGEYTITSQRDTSWMEYDPVYRIDVPKEGIVIDTLGTVSVKDSLFKNDTRYKEMMNIPFTDGKKFEMSAKMLDKNGYEAAVFEASAQKTDILSDQPEDLLQSELTTENITEDIPGSVIKVGSLEEVSTNGNWPTIYDAKTKRK